MVSRKLYSPDATQRHDDKDDEDDDPHQLALCCPGQSKNEQLGNRRRYYPYLATRATLGKEQETKVRRKKILRVIAKKNLFFLRQHAAGIEST